MQGGLFQRKKPVQRAFCEEVISMGKGRYLAQLNNYPAKDAESRFLDYLPAKTQGLLLTPLRPARNAPAEGLMVLGLDAMRGFGKVDQAWASAMGEKLAGNSEDNLSSSGENAIRVTFDHATLAT
eukprot:g17535.t1